MGLDPIDHLSIRDGRGSCASSREKRGLARSSRKPLTPLAGRSNAAGPIWPSAGAAYESGRWPVLPWSTVVARSGGMPEGDSSGASEKRLDPGAVLVWAQYAKERSGTMQPEAALAARGILRQAQ